MGFGNLGLWEIVVLALVVLIFFGPGKLPEIARSAGKALREFKRGVNEIRREFEEAERVIGGDEGPDGGPRPRGRIRPRADRPAEGPDAGRDSESVASADREAGEVSTPDDRSDVTARGEERGPGPRDDPGESSSRDRPDEDPGDDEETYEGT